jgi:hypothetical protein
LQSAFPRRLDLGDVDLAHLHHRVEGALGGGGIGVGDGFRQRHRRDLPGHAPFVLASTAGAFLAAIADDGVPIAVGLGRVPAKLRPRGSFKLSPDGIADLDGNVWEWTSGCANPAFAHDTCPAFIAMGEHEAVVPIFVRDPASGGCATGIPPANLGLRLVSDMAPPTH